MKRGKEDTPVITRIVSGGQTGADRAALDVAIELQIPHGGWVPKGRKTEAGILPAKYRMREMPTEDYPSRTEKNVLDSDATLIISHGELTGGSDYTRQMAQKHCKPYLHIDAAGVSVVAAVELIRTWIDGNQIKVLNVAGPRASEDPRIYSNTTKILKGLLQPAILIFLTAY